MGFVGSWMSQALRAGIAGFAIPFALVAVLAVLAIGGAFGGVASLGQVVVGPQVPLATTGSVSPASSKAGTGGPSPALPAIPGPRQASGSSARGGVVNRPAVTAPRAPSGSGLGQPPRRPRPTAGKHGAPTTSDSSHGSSGGAGGGGGGGGPGCGSPSCGSSSPDPVQQLVTKLQQSVPPATTVPQSPADAINTIQQLGSSIATSGHKLVSR